MKHSDVIINTLEEELFEVYLVHLLQIYQSDRAFGHSVQLLFAVYCFYVVHMGTLCLSWIPVFE